MTDPIDWSCLRCGSELEDRGDLELRFGGTGGSAKLLFGELAEVGEAKIRLRLLVCTECGQIAFHDPDLYEQAAHPQ